MISLRNRLLILILVLVPLSASFSAASKPEPPAVPRDYVVDLAGVVADNVRVRMNALLQELERKTGAQVLVLTVQSLDGQSIEEFAFATKERWRLGQKGKDNGVLLAVAVKDKKYRFEVGYGLESVLPDSLVGTIGREYLVPYFRKGDYSTGIFAATQAVIGTIAGHEGVEITGLSRIQPPRTATGRPLGTLNSVIFGIFIVVGLILFITHPRQCLLMLLAANMTGRGGGWSGGGGGFGGGGGSFGGGGGGSGGGGGASGGW